jgi:cytochrome c oxidase subunit 2
MADAQDDIVVKELHIPKGKKIHFKMRSQDVLHRRTCLILERK